MKYLSYILLFLSVLSFQFSNAHALWIESAQEGKLNQSHAIKIFYGEYEHQSIDAIDQWYSDVKDFKLFVISPDQKSTALSKENAGDHFTASFIPTLEGTYLIKVVHPARQPYEITAFEFSSLAQVRVGKSSNITLEQALGIQLQTIASPVGQEVKGQVYFKKEAYGEAELIIMGPHGWTKTIKTDSRGAFTFQPLIKGKYVLEVSKMEEEKQEWFGQSIEKLWRGSTCSFVVN